MVIREELEEKPCQELSVLNSQFHLSCELVLDKYTAEMYDLKCALI